MTAVSSLAQHQQVAERQLGALGAHGHGYATFCPGPTCLPSLNKLLLAKKQKKWVCHSVLVSLKQKGASGPKMGDTALWGYLLCTSTDLKEDTVTSALLSDHLGTSPFTKL